MSSLLSKEAGFSHSHNVLTSPWLSWRLTRCPDPEKPPQTCHCCMRWRALGFFLGRGTRPRLPDTRTSKRPGTKFRPLWNMRAFSVAPEAPTHWSWISCARQSGFLICLARRQWIEDFLSAGWFVITSGVLVHSIFHGGPASEYESIFQVMVRKTTYTKVIQCLAVKKILKKSPVAYS